MTGRERQAEARAEFMAEYAKKPTRPSLARYDVKVRLCGTSLTVTRITVKLKARDETGEGQPIKSLNDS